MHFTFVSELTTLREQTILIADFENVTAGIKTLNSAFIF